MSILDKITGRTKKAAGDLSGDAALRRQGAREERKGEAKEQLDNAQDKVAGQGRRGRRPREKDLKQQAVIRLAANYGCSGRTTPVLRFGLPAPFRRRAADADHACQRDRRFLEAEEADAVDHHGHRELAGDRRGRHATRAQRTHGQQHRRHVRRAQHAADQVVPLDIGCLAEAPNSPLTATMATSSAVPTRNEIAAAGSVPVTLPSPELIGACSAIKAADHDRRARQLQCPIHYFASIQFSPTPMSTTSGGSSSNAPSISRFTSSRRRSTSPLGALEQQLVVDRQHEPRRQAGLAQRGVGSAPSRS